MQSFNREDYIHKLEKENEELQQKWLDESYEKAKCIKSLNDKNKEIKELKEKLEHRNCVDCSNHGSNIKLIKAKDIIRDLLFHLGNTFIVSYTSKEESITKAEKFLGELD